MTTNWARGWTRAVVCGETGGNLTAWVHDCTDAWGSSCVYDIHGDAMCEGAVVGETQCFDGKDGDGDGKIDCDDEDCRCERGKCDDGIDNDNGTLVDCVDSDCDCD